MLRPLKKIIEVTLDQLKNRVTYQEDSQVILLKAMGEVSWVTHLGKNIPGLYGLF